MSDEKRVIVDSKIGKRRERRHGDIECGSIAPSDLSKDFIRGFIDADVYGDVCEISLGDKSRCDIQCCNVDFSMYKLRSECDQDAEVYKCEESASLHFTSPTNIVCVPWSQ